MMELLDNLTVSKLVAASGCTPAAAELWLPYFQAVLPNFGIITKNRIAAFISQCSVESNGFTALSENLNYSAAGLANTWPTRYAAKHLTTRKYIKDASGKYLPNKKAALLAHKPISIANNCYANRMGNGTEVSGDGWKFRGRGLKQLTGKDNYTMLSKVTGIDFVTNPDLLLEPGYAILSACVFWQANKLGPIADTGNVEVLTKAINGGTNGLEKRKTLYLRAIIALSS